MCLCVCVCVRARACVIVVWGVIVTVVGNGPDDTSSNPEGICWHFT